MKIHKRVNSDVNYIEFVDFQKCNDEVDLTVVSLFTGAGGLDIGLESAGFRTAVCVEYDEDCRETLRYNRPHWKLFEESTYRTSGLLKHRVPGDIRGIKPEELLDYAGLKIGEVSLVVGGAPCQPFSNIGKKLGKNDETNGDLFLEFVRMVKGIEPRAFIFENVVGITQQKHSEVIDYMTKQFEGLGYEISNAVLNAANYGVPQRRERFFLMGIKNHSKPAFPLQTHFKDRVHYDLVKKSLKDLTKDIEFKKWVSVEDAFKTIPKNSENRSDYALMKISDKVVERMEYLKEGDNFKALPMHLRPNCWKNGKHQGNDTFGRMISYLPSVTIRTAAYNPAKGQYIHPFENRGLSTIEMAVLQAFPTDWIFRCKKREKVTLVSCGRQIGNAVPPKLAAALGMALRLQLSLTQPISVRMPKQLPLVS